MLLAAALIVLAGASSAVSARTRLVVANVGLANGKTVAGAVSWQAAVSSGVANRVVFSIDGTSLWTEHVAPYVFDGDGNTLATSGLANGAHTFRVTAYPSSGTHGAVSASVTAVVSDSTSVIEPPVAASVPTISGTPAVGQSLTATAGDWTGSNPIVYTYQWKVCDGAGATCTATSASTPTLHVPSAAVGHTVRVSVTASNAAGSASSSSAATTVVTAATVAGPATTPPASAPSTPKPPATTAATTTTSTTTPSSSGSGSGGSSSSSGSSSSGSGSSSSGSPPSTSHGGVWAWDATSATVDPSSAAKVAAFQSYAVAAGTYLQATVAWVNSPAGTPSYAIPTAEVVSPVSVPVPLGTKVGVEADHALVVYGSDGVEYDLSAVNYDSSTGKITGTYGIATVQPGDAYETGPGGNNADAARFPLAKGPITPADIASGVINHPLVISMPNVGAKPSGGNPYPAAPGTDGYPGNTGLPLGTWIRLDPTVNVASLGLPKLETMIAVALQHYGMFVSDIGSELDIRLTDQVNQGGNAADWSAVGASLPISYQGVPYARQLSSAFPWTKLQVLLPPSH